ncbi:thiolase family protein [Conexibacter arvalis]|uniref:Acetyl-CoA acetyltransferase family protein n=1 Tax=Conexibacter arvalis TaxID=912552 RepID=A0A840I6G2_9ACTN|nr:thiolase family protein [Conexibacter arvalis]MBB4660516.1 acetyl-CoA acetyltransferase family protein [Conexibacter arvalis]
MSLHGEEVVIVAAARTPIGRGHPERGALRDVHPNELLGAAMTAAVERAGIAPQAVDLAVAGCVNQVGEQMMNTARNAWLQAGLPVETAAQTLDAQCGSSQQAVGAAASLIASGAHDVVLAAGVEQMSRIPIDAGWQAAAAADLGTPLPPALLERYELAGQGLAAEAVTDLWGLTRAELDALALRSHRLAARAADEGRFARELVPVATPDGVVDADQGIRRDTTAERLAQLPAAFRADGRITAGNSSQISDGAAAVLLASRRQAERLGLTPRAIVVDHVIVGVDPVTMLTGPIPATRRLLERNGLAVGDVDLFEVNEAFAPVVGGWLAEVGAELDRTNVNGGAMALGHPLGASGARLVTTLVHELERADRELGVVTMCCAGGLGTGTLIRRI